MANLTILHHMALSSEGSSEGDRHSLEEII